MKQIIVNVSGLTIEEKQRVNEALAKITKASKNKEAAGETSWFYAPSSYDVNQISSSHGKNPAPNKTPTHTPQQVLEMAGMATKRKVRADFDPTKEYSVDVSGCTEDGKKEVQQAFFDVGIFWSVENVKEHKRLNALQYSNTNGYGYVCTFLMYASTTHMCNMTPAEFLDLVYEPEQQGHVHADLMAQYAEDAKTTDKPWLLWQVKDKDGVWWECKSNPLWDGDTEYRRKPKTKLIHGVEVPDISFTPNDGEEYVYPNIYGENYASASRFYSGYDASEMALKAGCCYPYTEEGTQAAILHAKAWLGIA